MAVLVYQKENGIIMLLKTKFCIFVYKWWVYTKIYTRDKLTGNNTY